MARPKRTKQDKLNMAKVYRANERKDVKEDKFTETDTLREMIRQELAKVLPKEEE